MSFNRTRTHTHYQMPSQSTPTQSPAPSELPQSNTPHQSQQFASPRLRDSSTWGGVMAVLMFLVVIALSSNCNAQSLDAMSNSRQVFVNPARSSRNANNLSDTELIESITDSTSSSLKVPLTSTNKWLSRMRDSLTPTTSMKSSSSSSSSLPPSPSKRMHSRPRSLIVQRPREHVVDGLEFERPLFNTGPVIAVNVSSSIVWNEPIPNEIEWMPIYLHNRTLAYDTNAECVRAQQSYVLPFSIVVIARNEVKRLPKFFSSPSIQRFIAAGGEVLIADTGSIDATPELTEYLGGRVALLGDYFMITLTELMAKTINDRFVAPGEDPVVRAGESYFDFAAARNAAAAAASNDMVLMIDIGEYVESLEFETIERMISKDGVDFFEYVQYLSVDDSQKQTIGRFYDRRKVSWEGRTHEVVDPSGKPLHRAFLDSSILRCRYFRDLTRHRPYFTGLALELMDNDSPRWYHYLGREMYYTMRWRSAIALLEGSGSNPRAWNTERSASLAMAGDCYERIGIDERAIACYLMAINADWSRREPWLKLAQLYKRKQLYQPCVTFAEGALTIPQTSLLWEPYGTYQHEPHAVAYVCYWWLGNMNKSREHWEKALEYDPTNTQFITDRRFYESSETHSSA